MAEAAVDWRHKRPEDAFDPKPHALEPRYGADGKWTCYVCRGPVTDGGRTIDSSMKDLERGILKYGTLPQVTAEEPLGLQLDGS